MCSNHQPLHCVIPPYMLEKLAAHGKTSGQRETALRTLRMSQYIRARRRDAQHVFQSLGFQSLNLAAPSAPAKLVRTVYNAGSMENLPGKVVRSEGGKASKDSAVNEAYDGAGQTDGLFRN